MSESIITFNNRTLRVEGDGWSIEAKVLTSGRQLAITCNGSTDGDSEMIIRPDVANRIFISSRASEKETEQPDEQPDNQPAAGNGGNRRSPKR